MPAPAGVSPGRPPPPSGATAPRSGAEPCLPPRPPRVGVSEPLLPRTHPPGPSQGGSRGGREGGRAAREGSGRPRGRYLPQADVAGDGQREGQRDARAVLRHGGAARTEVTAGRQGGRQAGRQAALRRPRYGKPARPSRRRPVLGRGMGVGNGGGAERSAQAFEAPPPGKERGGAPSWRHPPPPPHTHTAPPWLGPVRGERGWWGECGKGVWMEWGHSGVCLPQENIPASVTLLASVNPFCLSKPLLPQ